MDTVSGSACELRTNYHIPRLVLSILQPDEGLQVPDSEKCSQCERGVYLSRRNE